MFKFSYVKFCMKGDDLIGYIKKLWNGLTLVIPGQACQTQLHILYFIHHDKILFCFVLLQIIAEIYKYFLILLSTVAIRVM